MRHASRLLFKKNRAEQKSKDFSCCSLQEPDNEREGSPQSDIYTSVFVHFDGVYGGPDDEVAVAGNDNGLIVSFDVQGFVESLFSRQADESNPAIQTLPAQPATDACDTSLRVYTVGESRN